METTKNVYLLNEKTSVKGKKEIIINSPWNRILPESQMQFYGQRTPQCI